MKLKAVVDSLDGVDEALRSLYAESDDGYVLQLDGIDDHPNVSGLKKTQSRALEQARKAKDERDELAARFDGIDPDKAREALAKYEEWEAKGGVPDEDAIPRELHEKRVEAAKQSARKDAEKLQGEVDRLTAALEAREIRGALKDAIAKAGVLEEYRDAVEALLLQRKPVVVWDEGEPRGVFKDELGDVTAIPDAVAAWAKTEAANPYMPSSGNEGTGSRGRGIRGTRGGANPFAKETRNITEQMRLMKENPEQARLLAQEAGVRIPKAVA